MFMPYLEECPITSYPYLLKINVKFRFSVIAISEERFLQLSNLQLMLLRSKLILYGSYNTKALLVTTV